MRADSHECLQGSNRKRLRDMFRAAFAKIRYQQVAMSVLTETRAAAKERTLLALHVTRFANHASRQLSGYDASDGRGRNRVVPRRDLSQDQVRNACLILAKPGSSRTLPEAAYLCDLIRALHVTVVNELSDAQLTYLATCVDGVTVQPGQSVFDVGDAADRFYIVLSGVLGVYVAPTDDAPMAHVGTLSPGRGFGERSILDEESRKATFRAASSPALLMSLSGATFNWMIQVLFDKKLRAKLEFFSNLPLCKHWVRRDIQRLALPFDSVDVRRRSVLKRQGESHQTIDIIVQGEFLVTRDSVQIASIGRGIAIEAYEALHGLACSNTVHCSAQAAATVYSVTCSDLMATFRSTHSAWASLLEHVQIMRRLMEAHFDSAAAGTKRREPEQKLKPAGSGCLTLLYQGLGIVATISGRSVVDQRPPCQFNTLAVDRQRSGKQHASQTLRGRRADVAHHHEDDEDFSFPDSFPYTVAIIDDADIGAMTLYK